MNGRMMGGLNKKTDIIIPVYNAFDELTRCLETVRKWTDLEQNRVVLINDKSTDARIEKTLDDWKQCGAVIINNKENKGFPQNVNIGMQQSKTHDVVLLNSDTLLTKGWLEKLAACAYSDSGIATVTPLSNNATLCSVPDFCRKNRIPDGYSLDEYAQLVEAASMKLYPEIPVANGFCMYIKREVIVKIGGFDAEAFGRGYGEENDFCYRAVQAGYYHAMCDDTFIFHIGTSSFTGKEKRKYIEEHEKLLDERYPKCMQAVRVHCRDNPNAVVAENIRMWQKLGRRRKRQTVMYLLQSDFRIDAQDHIGGTQLHVKDLTMTLRRNYDIVVAARNGSYLNVSLYMRDEELFFKYYIGSREAYVRFRSARFAGLYRKILENFQVDCVHVHHTAGLTLELFYEAAKKGIPILATMHDYYCICPNEKLLDHTCRLCIGREDKEACRQCLKEQTGIAQTVPYLQIWRSEHLHVLELCERIFVPSQSARQIVMGYFQGLQSKLTVIEHGVGPLPKPRHKLAESKKSAFHVAFLGGINMAKGYGYAADLIKKSDVCIKWFLFGQFEQKDRIRKKNFVNIGEYKREDLPRLFQKYGIDLACILPIWPETYCYTMAEALLCGVPVLVTDIGPLGERVRELECGWIIPNGAGSEEVLKKIYGIRNHTQDYNQKAACVRHIRLKTVEEMCMQYDHAYQKAGCIDAGCTNEYDGRWLLQGMMAGRENSISAWEGQEALSRQMQDMEKKMADMEQSWTYRLVCMLAKKGIPFKTQMKVLLRRICQIVGKRQK